MSSTSRTIAATPEQVWSVLADGWLYPLFVVGAARMREVDDTWPAVGSKLHHSVGSWPLMIDDTTEVLEVEERQRLLLLARGWPAGHAHVELLLEPRGADTLVTIKEQATGGPGALVPKVVQDPQLHLRNVEALRRLAFLVEGRAKEGRLP
ncbi:SRPBCC family protein [Nocardioides KLBMP 9356]|uniref:SRPBCC family protein n=1 Tax=Nocardioides potassii TaxID=2911371 RepID=A0ABS9HCT9_9ACTN|nr:SRPBCC family protein [Nocardioides potassii]MCF6377873.1 SRPBCC family protein [Nocardioides potassii]